MNIGSIFAHAVVRRVAFVLVALVLGWVGIGRADAFAGMTKQQAYDSVRYTGSDFCPVYGDPTGVESAEYVETDVWPDGSHGRVTAYYKCDGGTVAQASATWDLGECPSGQTWNSATLQCETPFDAAECLARNSDLGANGGEPRPSLTTERCVAGCKFSMKPGEYDTSTSAISGGTAATIYRGVMEYSGDACGALPVDPLWDEEKPKEPLKQECTPLGGGQTACRQPDGRVCYTGTPDRQICWVPGETGEKTDGPLKQKTDPGNTPIPPSMTLPSGDTLTQTGEPVSTTVTKNGTTVVTTTTNYVTTNGTNAGTANDGQPADGSGSGEEGGEEGGVTGGVGCAEADKPVVSGDPLLGNIVLQAWGTRCAVESGNSVTSTGVVDDCSTPFTVTGPEKSVEVLKLKAMRAQICPGVPAEEITDGKTGEVAADGGIWKTETSATWLGKLSDAGFLSGPSCPAIPVFNLGSFGTYSPDIPYWCQLIEMLGAFVLFAASVGAIMIIME